MYCIYICALIQKKNKTFLTPKPFWAVTLFPLMSMHELEDMNMITTVLKQGRPKVTKHILIK